MSRWIEPGDSDTQARDGLMDHSSSPPARTPARGALDRRLAKVRKPYRLVQELERVLSSRFTIVEIEHTTKPFAAMNRIIG
jgi:hypothetical protein